MSVSNSEIIFFVSYSIGAAIILKFLFRQVDKLVAYLTRSNNISTNWKKNAPYTEVVRETIHYTNSILYKNGIKYFPKFEIHYRNHKKFDGFFNGEIKIYLKNHSDIPTLVTTALHEVAHYLQAETDTNFKNYDYYTNTIGYWDNPFEKSARKFAREHLDSCLRYLEQKNLIERH